MAKILTKKKRFKIALATLIVNFALCFYAISVEYSSFYDLCKGLCLINLPAISFIFADTMRKSVE